MQKKRLLALLTAVCLAVPTGIMPGQTAPASDADATVINVTDYGADPSGVTDSTPGIRAAIEAAKEVDGPVVLNFPTGRYDIYPDQAEERELYISNTVGTNQSYKDKNIGILIEDMSDVTVEGNDSLFMFHGKMTTFATIDSENVTFQNFEVDFQVPTVVDMTVEKKEGNTVTYYIPECYNYQVDGTSIRWTSDVSPYTGQPYWTTTNSMNYTQIYDTKNGNTWRAGNPIFSNVSTMEDLGNHRVQVTYSNADSIQEGYCYQMRTTVRDHAGTFFWQSKNVTLNHLDVRFLHGFGMVGQFTENVTLNDVDFETDPASGRTTAGYADFIQMSGCKGLIEISDCTFSNPHDDPINIHGTFLQVVDISEDRTQVTVQYMHNETAGFPNYYVGDQVEFATRGNMVPVSENGEVAVRNVVAVDGPDGRGGKGSLNDLTKIVLTLDEPIPQEITPNATHVVENITYTPNVKIHDNVFKETPTRGILCTTRGKVEITDNLFDRMGMASIYISNDAQGWYESGRTTDVTIQGNTFLVSSAPGILVEPTNGNVNGTVHKNMTIQDNTFYLLGNQQVLNAKCVENLTFQGNRVYRQDPNVVVTASAADASLAVGESTQLEVSTSAGELGSRLYQLNGCKNVLVQDNFYDGGLNPGMTLYNTDEDQVTIQSDDAVTNQDNRLDKDGTLVYLSSNEDVVTVSAEGVVRAVGNGSAQVTASAVVGGRAFTSAPVEFQVGGQAQPQATAISITTQQDTLTQEQMTYTAQVIGEEGADTSVTWSVVDPVTGEATQRAEMDAATGVLTAKSSGAVEVIAKTVNGLDARALLSIQLDEECLADGITIENEDASLWHVAGKDQIYAKAAVGGTFQQQVPANWFKLPVDSDTTEVTLKIQGKTRSSWEDVGLYLGKDADNYVAIQRKHRGGSVEEMGMVSESNQKGSEQLAAVDQQNEETMYFRLLRDGNSVTAFYSLNGTEWTQFGDAMTNDTFLPDADAPLYVAFGAMRDNGADGNTAYTFSQLTVDGVPVSLTQTSTAQLPTAQQVQVAYSDTYNTLTAAYTLSEGATALVKWAVSDTQEGTYSLLPGQQGDVCMTTGELTGKFVKAIVVPVTSSGITGNPVYSQAVEITGDGIQGLTAPSANAFLATADLQGLSQGFAFDPATLTYFTTAGQDETVLHTAFAAQDPNATVAVRFNGTQVDSQGDLALTCGRNVVEVTVTAEDQITQRHYRFVLIREGNDAASLTTLTVDGTQVELVDGVYQYNVPVDQAKEVLVELTADETATVTMACNGSVVENGRVALQPGINPLYILVSPQTSAQPTRYVVNLNVPDPSNSALSQVIFGENVRLSENFDPQTTQYTGIVISGKTALTVTAQEADATVKVSVNGMDCSDVTSIPLHEGTNEIVITVTSPDGANQTTYTFQLEGKSVLYLSDLDWEANSTCGWGSLTKDQTYDGNPISLLEEDGTVRTFQKGIWSHADANIYYDLEGKGYQQFETYVGVDATQKDSPAAVTFKVFIDGQEVASTQEMRGTDAMEYIKVDIPQDAKTLHLQVLKGEVDHNDHADWADAKFISTFETAEAPDTTLLQKIYDYAQAQDTSDLIDSVAKLYEDAMNQARAILDHPENATQEMVEKACDDLLNAIHLLDFKKGDKTMLELVITRANEMMDHADQYVEANWQQLVDALEAANQVKLDGEAMQGEVDEATEALLNAILAQRYQADKSILEDLISKAENLNLEGYTAESVATFRSALAQAQAVLADKTLSEDDQKTVDAAVTALTAAMDGLTAGGAPEATNQPEASEKPEATQKPENHVPQTGDTAPLTLAVTALVLAAGALAVVEHKRRNGAR